MSKVRSWEELRREDLKKILYYRILGWKPQFHEKDIRADRTTPDKVPHEAVSYAKKNTRIWLAEKVIQNTTVMVWMAADLVDGYWKNHRQYGTLDKAIEIENDAMDKPWNEKAQIPEVLIHTFEMNGRIARLNKDEFDALSNTFVSKPNTGVLSPDNRCGDSEYGTCDYCGSLANVHRKYWHYPIKCDCHGPTHFEMVRYCTGCEDKVTEPKQTMVCTHHEDGSQWNILMPTSILIKSEE